MPARVASCRTTTCRVSATTTGPERPGTPGFCIAIHAEVNALLFATRDTKGATAYITDPPCPGCRKALAAAGVVRAVWPDGEHDREGLTTWSRP